MKKENEEESIKKKVQKQVAQAEVLKEEAATQVQKAAPAFLTSLNADPSLSEDQKEKVAMYASNKEAIKNKIDKTAKGEDSGDISLSENFKEALTFFGPQLIGGLIGGLVEGDAGAVAGFEAGTQARNMMTSYEAQQQQQRGRAAQQAQGWETVDGQPLSFDPNTKAYYTPDGNKYAGRIVNSITKRANANIGQRIEDRANLKKQQLAQLSDKQVESLKGLEQTTNSIERIKNLKKRVSTGPVESRAKSIGELFGASPQEFTQLKTEVANLTADYIRAISVCSGF
jgi:hypothetical protein